MIQPPPDKHGVLAPLNVTSLITLDTHPTTDNPVWRSSARTSSGCTILVKPSLGPRKPGVSFRLVHVGESDQRSMPVYVYCREHASHPSHLAGVCHPKRLRLRKTQYDVTEVSHMTSNNVQSQVFSPHSRRGSSTSRGGSRRPWPCRQASRSQSTISTTSRSTASHALYRALPALRGCNCGATSERGIVWLQLQTRQGGLKGRSVVI